MNWEEIDNDIQRIIVDNTTKNNILRKLVRSSYIRKDRDKKI